MGVGTNDSPLDSTCISICVSSCDDRLKIRFSGVVVSSSRAVVGSNSSLCLVLPLPRLPRLVWASTGLVPAGLARMTLLGYVGLFSPMLGLRAWVVVSWWFSSCLKKRVGVIGSETVHCLKCWTSRWVGACVWGTVRAPTTRRPCCSGSHCYPSGIWRAWSLAAQL